MPPSKSQPRVLYWFRTDLRLHDSPALSAALSLNPSVLYPIWTWDPHYVYRARVGPNRWRFLLDCQTDLSASLTKLNPKQKLLIMREAPQTLFPKLLREWEITHVVFERDTDAYARDRDEEVRRICEGLGVEVLSRSGRTLWDSDEIVKANGGKPTMSITQLQKAGEKVGEIAKPIPAPTSLPDPGDTGLSFEQQRPGKEPDINAIQREEGREERSYEQGVAGPKGDFAVPTMEELGLKPATTPHRGGETVALKTLDNVLKDKTYTATFEKPKTAPTAFEPQSTCLTSPHLHFGTLSVRLFYHRVLDTIRTFKGKPSTPPTSLTGQLLFRDMYFAAQAALGFRFAQAHNNPNCRFVPWHLPSVIDPTTGLITGAHQTDSAEASEHFRRWKAGLTGFPWIDALMRQLRTEGWIHHLGRHAVACFLTRGGCYIHWERGAEVFEEWLIDHEVACNAGNWQWLACVAFYAQFYRCYSPVAFPKKWDGEGAFVRRYVPELRHVPEKWIYEPWKMSIRDQREAGVVIKGTGLVEGEMEGEYRMYPKPMLDFPERREACIQGMKQAYEVGLYGNHEKVLDGTWKEMFPDGGEGPTEGTKAGPGGMIGHEDALGDEHVVDGARSPKVARRTVKKEVEISPRANRGHKREPTQDTLEHAFKKVRK